MLARFPHLSYACLVSCVSARCAQRHKLLLQYVSLSLQLVSPYVQLVTCLGIARRDLAYAHLVFHLRTTCRVRVRICLCLVVSDIQI